MITKPDYSEVKEQTSFGHHRNSINSTIVGYWVEEKSRRNNFEVFLSKLKTDIDVNKTNYSPFDWEREKVIYLDDNVLTINEVRPKTRVSQWKVTLNNETLAKIDVELLGVFSNAMASMSNDSIIVYVLRTSSREILLTISYA